MLTFSLCSPPWSQSSNPLNKRGVVEQMWPGHIWQTIWSKFQSSKCTSSEWPQAEGANLFHHRFCTFTASNFQGKLITCGCVQVINHNAAPKAEQIWSIENEGSVGGKDKSDTQQLSQDKDMYRALPPSSPSWRSLSSSQLKCTHHWSFIRLTIYLLYLTHTHINVVSVLPSTSSSENQLVSQSINQQLQHSHPHSVSQPLSHSIITIFTLSFCQTLWSISNHSSSYQHSKRGTCVLTLPP